MAQDAKTYKYAGWSFYNGEWRLRFANDSTRARHLKKVGHEHVNMFLLPHAMTEYEASRYVFSIPAVKDAGWRQWEADGWEAIDLLETKYHVWWCEWQEEHPEIYYPASMAKAA
jgi:hypothetical protein